MSFFENIFKQKEVEEQNQSEKQTNPLIFYKKDNLYFPETNGVLDDHHPMTEEEIKKLLDTKNHPEVQVLDYPDNSEENVPPPSEEGSIFTKEGRYFKVIHGVAREIPPPPKEENLDK